MVVGHGEAGTRSQGHGALFCARSKPKCCHKISRSQSEHRRQALWTSPAWKRALQSWTRDANNHQRLTNASLCCLASEDDPMERSKGCPIGRKCRGHGPAEACFCRVFQGFPRSQPRRGPLLQSVSRIPAPAASPRPAFAECFKETPRASRPSVVNDRSRERSGGARCLFLRAKRYEKVHMLFFLSLDSSTSLWSCVKAWPAA